MKKLLIFVTGLIVLSGCGAQNQITNGTKAEISGTISDQPWQHMVDFPEEYVFLTYIDYNDGDQIVAYSKEYIECQEAVMLSGEYFLLEGTSKRPGSDEPYSEMQFKVNSYECLTTNI